MERNPVSWNYIGVLPKRIGKTTNGVHIGALVSINDHASYWNGLEVESWYRRRNWYVTGLDGNKANLGKDETGKYTMRIPISTNFLTVIKNSEEIKGEIENDNCSDY